MKGSRRRQLTLTGSAESAWNALTEEIERREVKEGHVFRQWRRLPYYEAPDILDGLDLKKNSPIHGFRHTFASFAIKSGWTIAQLAKWLGHTDHNTTLSTYGHLMSEAPPKIRFE